MCKVFVVNILRLSELSIIGRFRYVLLFVMLRFEILLRIGPVSDMKSHCTCIHLIRMVLSAHPCAVGIILCEEYVGGI